MYANFNTALSAGLINKLWMNLERKVPQLKFVAVLLLKNYVLTITKAYTGQSYRENKSGSFARECLKLWK